MANKGVVLVTNYSFNAAAKTITLSAEYSGLVLSDVMYITNVKSGVAATIYDPFDAAKGGTLSGRILTLAYDTTAMANSDPLQIIIGKSDLKQSVSVDDLSMMFMRLMQQLARPPYMTPVGNIRTELASSLVSQQVVIGSGAVTVVTSLTQLGAALIDQSFTYFTQNREAFNVWKNNIIN